MFPAINLGALERYRVPTTGERLRLSEIHPHDRKGLRFRERSLVHRSRRSKMVIARIVRVTLDTLD